MANNRLDGVNYLLSVLGVVPDDSLRIQRLLIKDHKTISWNKLYAQNHWALRKKLADEIHTTVGWECKAQNIRPAKGPVIIMLIAYKTRTIDPDNICAKLYIDGLKKSEVIVDDTPKYVDSVVTKSIKSKENSLEIIIAEAI